MADAIDPPSRSPRVRAKHRQANRRHLGGPAMWPAMIFIPQSDNHWQITPIFGKPHTAVFSVLLFIFTFNVGEKTRHEP